MNQIYKYPPKQIQPEFLHQTHLIHMELTPIPIQEVFDDDIPDLVATSDVETQTDDKIV